MRFSQALVLSAFVTLVGAGAGFAQPAPATKPPAAAPATPAATATDTDKKAISKACSDQATTKGLHGKERKAFRSECKKNGGKPA